MKSQQTINYVNTVSICSTQNSVAKYTYIKCVWINKPRTLSLQKVLVENQLHNIHLPNQELQMLFPLLWWVDLDKQVKQQSGVED